MGNYSNTFTIASQLPCGMLLLVNHQCLHSYVQWIPWPLCGLPTVTPPNRWPPETPASFSVHEFNSSKNRPSLLLLSLFVLLPICCFCVFIVVCVRVRHFGRSEPVETKTH